MTLVPGSLFIGLTEAPETPWFVLRPGWTGDRVGPRPRVGEPLPLINPANCPGVDFTPEPGLTTTG